MTLTEIMRSALHRHWCNLRLLPACDCLPLRPSLLLLRLRQLVLFSGNTPDVKVQMNNTLSGNKFIDPSPYRQKNGEIIFLYSPMLFFHCGFTSRTCNPSFKQRYYGGKNSKYKDICNNACIVLALYQNGALCVLFLFLKCFSAEPDPWCGITIGAGPNSCQ